MIQCRRMWSATRPQASAGTSLGRAVPGSDDHCDRLHLGTFPSVFTSPCRQCDSAGFVQPGAIQRQSPRRPLRPSSLLGLDGRLLSAPQPDAGRASAGLPTRNRPSSTAAPKSTRVSGGVSPNGRSPLGFELRFFQRTDATSLPSGSTWPCFPDRARVWPSACSRRRVSEIRQGGFIGVSHKFRARKGWSP